MRPLAESPAGHPLPLAAVCVVAHHAHTGLRNPRMHPLAGRNGVQPRHQPLQHVEQFLRRCDCAGKIRDQVDELASPAILLGARLVVRPAHLLQRVDSLPTHIRRTR